MIPEQLRRRIPGLPGGKDQPAPRERSAVTAGLDSKVRDPLVAVMQARLNNESGPEIVNAGGGLYLFKFDDRHPDGSATSLNIRAVGVRDDKLEPVAIDPEGVVSISAFVGTARVPSRDQVVYIGPYGRDADPRGKIRKGLTANGVRTTTDKDPQIVLDDMVGLTEEFLAKYA